METEREHDRWIAAERERGYIRARLRLVSVEDGGRKTGIASGYRSHWAFPPTVHPDDHDAPLTLEAGPDRWLEPGEEAVVRLHPLVPELWPPVTSGLQLTMLEGSRLVGVAEVIEVVPASG